MIINEFMGIILGLFISKRTLFYNQSRNLFVFFESTVKAIYFEQKNEVSYEIS